MNPLLSWILVLALFLGVVVYTLVWAWLLEWVATQRYKPKHRRSFIHLPGEDDE